MSVCVCVREAELPLFYGQSTATVIPSELFSNLIIVAFYVIPEENANG